MVTYVGTEINFLQALNHLIQLDYDAVEAYDAAIERLKSTHWREVLKSFREDHKRHITIFTGYLRDLEYAHPQGPSLKSILTQGKVMIANLSGDKAILLAMRSNELDTNTAYKRMLEHPGLTDDLFKKVNDAYDDEKRHLSWIEKTIKE